MPSNPIKRTVYSDKNIIFIAVLLFAISLTIITREVVAQDASGEMTPSFPVPLSTPEPDVPAAQDDGDEKLPSLVISATGYEIPQSRVSSDITVITKEDISHLPAHDVGEALNYVTGVTLTRGGGPGTPPSPSIQGSDYTHVKILIDDIPIETLSSGFPDLSLIPLESVDRIEILKGSASSVWGSSLGGVINVITKQPGEKIQLDGGISIGENSTRNYKVGISGKVKDTGYFFSASRFETDGFFDYQKAKNNYFYAKLTEEVNPKLKAELSYGYTGIDREDSGFIATELTYENHGRVMLTYTPKEDYELSISAYDRHIDTRSVDIASNTDNYRDRENMYGGIFRSVWHHSKESTFSMGLEGSHGNLKLSTAATDENYDTDKGAVFANESLGIGALTLNAGARYDNDSAFGSELSPSAGVVYKIAAGTFVRVNAARGFSPPPLPYRYHAEKKESEKRLVEVERMAALGKLAGSVAHEINNPLAIMKNYIFVMSKNKMAEENPNQKYLKIIDGEIERVAKIIRDFNDFYKGVMVAELEEFDMSAPLKEVLAFCKVDLATKGITVEERVDESGKVMADKDKLKQVFLNLIKNAGEAMPNGGRVTVKTRKENGRIYVFVTDTGMGIKPEHTGKVFEPFFTTKGVKGFGFGFGLGLGLTVTYGIIKSFGGDIEVESEAGKGTTFKVMLPTTSD